MNIIDALQTKAAPQPVGWGCREFTGPGVFAAIVETTELSEVLVRKLDILLSSWNGFYIKISMGAHTSFEDFLKSSTLYDLDNKAYTSKKDMKKEAIVAWKDTLLAANALVEQSGVVKVYGSAQHCKNYLNIAKKFKKDHFTENKKSAMAHAKARLETGKVPASTSILAIYGKGLDEEVGALNGAEVFSSVEWYLNTIKGWSVSDSVVDSIGWFSKSKVTAYTYTRKGDSTAKLNEQQVSGYLMYAAQSDEVDSKRQLMYHYSAIEATPENPASFARAPKGGPWTCITADEVVGKLSKLQAHQRTALTDNWPIVYYSI